MQATDLAVNPKYQAIQAHQVGSAFLDRFVHRDEIFWIEPDGTDHAPSASAGLERAVASASTAGLDGSQSADPDGDTLTYTWTQLSGPTVTLSVLGDRLADVHRARGTRYALVPARGR